MQIDFQFDDPNRYTSFVDGFASALTDELALPPDPAKLESLLESSLAGCRKSAARFIIF